MKPDPLRLGFFIDMVDLYQPQSEDTPHGSHGCDFHP